MSIAESLNAVRDAAQMLTRDGQVLTFASTEYPLAQFADSYNVQEEPQQVEMTDELAVSVEDHFEEINEDATPIETDSREQLIENVHLGLSKTLFTTNNVIIPAIKDMHSYFAGLQSRTSQPEYRVDPFVYADVHNSAALVNHVNTRYTRVRPQAAYKTYRLNPISADSIIEAVAVNNPHLEQEEVTEWALQMGSERVEAVWFSLFGGGGEVAINGLPYMTMQSAPFSVDEIALAYFICGHYMDNPEQVPGEDVGLDEWTVTMQLLHECFGFYLGRAYMNRLDMRERGELILRNEAQNPIETRRAVVIVNNDVSAPWLMAGGDIQAVLGAAIESPGTTTLEGIERNREHFIKRWLAIYPLIKQSAIDFADRQTRNDIVTTFLRMTRETALKDMPADEVDKRMQAALRTLSRDDLKNAYKTFATLIVEVYFPNSNYKQFLESIDEYGQDFPSATLRELNTQAIITLTAIFLAKQVTLTGYVADIDPNATAQTGVLEDTTDFDEGVIAVQMDEESAPEVPDVEVEGVEVEESTDAGDISEVDETVDTTDDFVAEEETTDTTDDANLDEGDDSFDTDEEEDPYSDLDEGEEETGGVEEDSQVAEESEEEAEETTEDESENEEETPLA